MIASKTAYSHNSIMPKTKPSLDILIQFAALEKKASKQVLKAKAAIEKKIEKEIDVTSVI